MVSIAGSHSTRVLLRWRDFDLLGHVYHAVLVELLDQARVEWMRRNVFHGADRHYVVARLEINYLAEIALGVPHVEVVTQLGRVGRSSLDLLATVRSPSGATVARCESTVVLWDEDRRASRVLSRSERHAALAFGVLAT